MEVDILEQIIYLDNSATTKPCKTACEYIDYALKNTWGNPSSLHTLGIDAEILVDKARKTIAKSIKALPEEIIFTGCGTEANNTAIMSVLARKNRGNRIITTKIEHPSVLETVKRLEKYGFEIITLDIKSNGIIDLDELKDALNDKTVLVSTMLVNNEIGSVEPIAEINKLIREKSPNALFHCDAVQGYGKLPIDVKKLGVDLLSVSAHKVHGPKGIGFLFKRRNITIPPYITGGGQEGGMRSGTESVPLIAGFMGACEEFGDLNESLSKVKELNLYAKKVLEDTGLVKINSTPDALPYILNVSVTGYRSETLLHFLNQKNIFISSGSACSKGELSHVLLALGLTKSEIDSALRISFTKENTREEIDILANALTEAAAKLRRVDI